MQFRKRVLIGFALWQQPPVFLRGRLHNAYHSVLEVLAESYQREGATAQQERAWKLVMLMWRMLLRRTSVQGAVGKEEFNSRFERFEQGRWTELLDEALTSQVGRSRQGQQGNTRQSKKRYGDYHFNLN